jgi:hypothetical protein
MCEGSIFFLAVRCKGKTAKGSGLFGLWSATSPNSGGGVCVGVEKRTSTTASEITTYDHQVRFSDIPPA